MKLNQKEKAKDRRERQAKELEAAYNNGGDYKSILAEIKSNGDVWEGRLSISASGVDGAVDVRNHLPDYPENGWEVELYFVRIYHNPCT